MPWNSWATTAEANTREAILKATRELLALMIRQNDIRQEDVASAIFSTTTDLDAEFPALAARQLGWFDAALLCGNELDVPGSLRRCIRVLLHWNTEKAASEIVHVYVQARPICVPTARICRRWIGRKWSSGSPRRWIRGPSRSGNRRVES